MEETVPSRDDLHQDILNREADRCYNTVASAEVESTRLSVSANNVSVNDTEFKSKFERLLEGLSGWKAVQVKESDSVMSRLICECENIVKSKSTVAVQQTDIDHEHTLIQKASQILHDLVCLHTPGMVLIVYHYCSNIGATLNLGALWDQCSFYPTRMRRGKVIGLSIVPRKSPGLYI